VRFWSCGCSAPARSGSAGSGTRSQMAARGFDAIFPLEI
jgi:hypothetical protein